MKNSGKLSRIFLALSLILSLSFASSLTIYAQQPTQKQVAAPQAKTAKAAEKESAEGEPIPLSDAEMEKVEGGNPFAIAIGVVALGFAAYSYYQSRRAHQQILKTCATGR